MNRSDEKEMGKWSLQYFPPSGGRYSGTITITNLRLLFYPHARLKDKNKSLSIDISKNEISSVRVNSNLLQKSVVISVKGKCHSFSKLFFNTNEFVNLLKK